MNEDKQTSIHEQGKLEGKFAGVRLTTAHSHGFLVFISKTNSVALPTHEVIRIDYGEQTDFTIQLSTRRFLAVVEGVNLHLLFSQLTTNSVYEIEEWHEPNKSQKELCYATKIQVLDLAEQDQEGGGEDDHQEELNEEIEKYH